mmetsp:Transcript_22481/g.33705  ORF Transcript_22481/g.33705 Transcript_22481/m.33705 type:complete len:673 (-) Transcript_22481:180-2198(-)|eukprot:CAMPEP_0116020126 /NCGR_PEP_ID=MMETSP0321-20121206/9622_1 /TAXON_ID=163516 /ORGANISM="Leptocylindrus danicus var. danicus, Strain B650" /LENGTH=672 /DNA_ID=CAMNT_0003490779 /DNA_START=183 /DNA_END=2201 /DNA_ORIENTATION=-
MARYQDSSASDRRYENLNKKLQRFKRKNKRETDDSLAQFEWLREYSLLKRDEIALGGVMDVSIVAASELLLNEVAKKSEYTTACKSNFLSADSADGDDEEEEESEKTFEDECQARCVCAKCASCLSTKLVAKVASLQGIWEEEIRRLSVVMDEVRNCLGVLKGEQRGSVDGNRSALPAYHNDTCHTREKNFLPSLKESSASLDVAKSGSKESPSASSCLANCLILARDNFKETSISLDQQMNGMDDDIKLVRKVVRRSLIEDEKMNGGGVDIIPAKLNESIESTQRLLIEQNYDEGDITGFDILRQKMYQSFSDLEEHHKKLVLKAREKFVASCPGISPNDPFGGWDEKEHLKFLNSMGGKMYVKVTLIHKLFPERTEKEIQRYVNWWEQYRFLKEKSNAAALSLQKKRSSLCAVSLKKIDSFIKAIRLEATNKIDLSLKSICRDERRARLEVLREVTDEVAKHEAQQRAKEESERNRINEQNVKRNRARAQTLKIAVNQLKKERQERDEKNEATARALVNVKRKARRQRIENNKGRVSHRAMLMKMKQEQEESERQQAKNEAERRAEKLRALALCVPYQDSISSMKAVYRTKSTAARQNDVYVEDTTGRASFQHGMSKFTSFTNEKVFSNALFRLGNALHDAGIAQSDYARAAVKRLVPREPERTTGIMPF